ATEAVGTRRATGAMAVCDSGARHGAVVNSGGGQRWRWAAVAVGSSDGWRGAVGAGWAAGVDELWERPPGGSLQSAAARRELRGGSCAVATARWAPSMATRVHGDPSPWRPEAARVRFSRFSPRRVRIRSPTSQSPNPDKPEP